MRPRCRYRQQWTRIFMPMRIRNSVSVPIWKAHSSLLLRLRESSTSARHLTALLSRNEKGGYGFIEPDNKSEPEIFVHATNNRRTAGSFSVHPLPLRLR